MASMPAYFGIMIPSELSHLIPYLRYATEFNETDVVMSFSCLMHAAKMGVPCCKTSELKAVVSWLISSLEAMRPSVVMKAPDVLLQQKYAVEFVTNMFLEAERNFKQDSYTQEQVDNLRMIGDLFNVILPYFGDKDAHAEAQARQERTRAMEDQVRLMIQEPKQPVDLLSFSPTTQPLIVDVDHPVLSDVKMCAETRQLIDLLPSPPTVIHLPPPPVIPSPPTIMHLPPPPVIPEPVRSRSVEHHSSHAHECVNCSRAKGTPPEVIVEASKYIKFVSNALDYDDISAALNSLNHMIKILSPYSK